MPNPNQPKLRRGAPGPEQLPKGAATRLNQLAKPVQGPSKGLDRFARPPEPDFAAAPREIIGGPPVVPQEMPPMQGDITGFDDILFGPTDRPEEPITAGAPFGPGPSFPRHGFESDEEFMARVANELAQSPAASSYVKAFAARVLRGE